MEKPSCFGLPFLFHAKARHLSQNEHVNNLSEIVRNCYVFRRGILYYVHLCSRLIHLWYCIKETFCWSQSRSASDGCFLLIRTCLQEPSTALRENRSSLDFVGAAKKEGPDAGGTQIINQKKSLSMLSFWSQALRRLYGRYDLVQIKECGRCSALLGCLSKSKSKPVWSPSLSNQ